MALSESELIGLGLALGAREAGVLSPGEVAVAAGAAQVSEQWVQPYRAAIGRGEDPLGEAFCALRSAAERRPMGATYTPAPIVTAMTDWASSSTPERIVDPGAGTGRFIVAAGRRFPHSALVAVEADPLVALLLRAHLVTAGLAERAKVLVCDYRELALERIEGATLFIGNPPYVRHHSIGPSWKAWLVERAYQLGLPASQLAGLHVHFFVATALYARSGDSGAFITAAEWLDVNYGALVRKLLLGKLGGKSLHLLEPTIRPFSDADTTAVITCFEVGTEARSLRLRRVESVAALASLGGGRAVRRERLVAAARWTPFTRSPAKTARDFVELGELCRVHRGQVTGANGVWITNAGSGELPENVLFPCVTKARELFAAGEALADASALRRVIDLPVDLDTLESDQRSQVERFLRSARQRGANQSFIARHRKAWWSVGLREPAPILATYMARRPPAFVRNLAGARHINIAHGLYPRDPLADRTLDALSRYLSSAISVADGRTYSGGLTKFEPREMERLLVPGPKLLEQLAT